MCFRPPEVSQPINCPSCGKEVSTMGGGAAECPYCGADIRAEMEAAGVTLRKAVAGFGKPAAPVTPNAPAAPATPKVPGTPGTPKSE